MHIANKAVGNQSIDALNILWCAGEIAVYDTHGEIERCFNDEYPVKIGVEFEKMAVLVNQLYEKRIRGVLPGNDIGIVIGRLTVLSVIFCIVAMFK